jgi:hypothetical protein
MKPLIAFLLFCCPLLIAAPAEFNIEKFGATPDDETDDTASIAAALAACGKAGGGVVFIPAGIFIVARQGVEEPILQVPSNTVLRGEGAASITQLGRTDGLNPR